MKEVKKLNSTTVEVILSPIERKINFNPGQYVYVSIDCTKGCGVSHEFHPFSLDSNSLNLNSSDSGLISIAVSALGDDTKKLIQVFPGNRALIEGPYGNLLSDLKPQNKQLWIAGGIGVTPFISFIRRWNSEMSSLSKDNIVLLLLLKNQAANVFKPELEMVVGGLTIKYYYDELFGKIDGNKFHDLLPVDLIDREVVISGPIKMVQFCKQELCKLKVKKVRTEEFDYL